MRKADEIKIQTPSQIDVFQFANHRDYLQALLAERRARKRTNSLRQLSARAGFRSAGTLSMILSGKRHLTAAAAEKLSQAIGLQGRRRRYFLALARLDSSRKESDRNQIRAELIRLKSMVEENFLEAKQYRFLSTWYYVVLLVLVGQKSFRANYEDLAERLGRQVSPQQVEQALNDLVDLGLVENEGSSYRQTSGAFTTRDDIRDTAVFLYHKKMNELAAEALELPLNEREFNGVTVEIPIEQLANVKKKIRLFRKELNEYLSQFSGNGEVYQLNVQLFPLTRKNNFSSIKGETKS